VIGDGLLFFDRTGVESALHLKGVTAYKSGMVELRYEVRKGRVRARCASRTSVRAGSASERCVETRPQQSRDRKGAGRAGATRPEHWGPSAPGRRPRRRATPANAAGTSGSRAGTPRTRARTPRSRARTPGTRAGTPGTRARTPGTRARTPRSRARTPGTCARTPGTRAGTPWNGGKRPIRRKNRPGGRKMALTLWPKVV
jgi:hypothetical protein